MRECSSARSAAGDARVSEWARGVGQGGGLSEVRALSPLLFSADKLWFCCLSPNHKVLQYGDVEEGANPPTLENLPEQRKEGRGRAPTPAPSPCWPHTPYLGSTLGHGGQPSLFSTVPVADIRALLMGKDCPHVREKGSGKQNKVIAVGSEARAHLSPSACSLLRVLTPTLLGPL